MSLYRIYYKGFIHKISYIILYSYNVEMLNIQYYQGFIHKILYII